MRHLPWFVVLFSLGCGDVQLPVQPPPPPPAFSFSLSGQVTDTANRPLGGSTVAVVDGPRPGTLATTNDAGRFSMPGIFTGTITVTASKEGYVSQTRIVPPRVPVPVPPPGEVPSWSTAFQLEPIGPSLDIAGEYTLTVTADSACTDFPAEARTRTYTATVVPASGSSGFAATLGGARFLSPTPWCNVGPPWLSCSYNTFFIGMAGDFASVNVGIMEQLGDPTYLWVGAGTQAPFGPTGITAPMSGYFLYCPSEPSVVDQGTWACRDGVQCDSEHHQLKLVRR